MIQLHGVGEAVIGDEAADGGVPQEDSGALDLTKEEDGVMGAAGTKVEGEAEDGAEDDGVLV